MALFGFTAVDLAGSGASFTKFFSKSSTAKPFEGVSERAPGLGLLIGRSIAGTGFRCMTDLFSELDLTNKSHVDEAVRYFLKFASLVESGSLAHARIAFPASLDRDFSQIAEELCQFIKFLQMHKIISIPVYIIPVSASAVTADFASHADSTGLEEKIEALVQVLKAAIKERLAFEDGPIKIGFAVSPSTSSELTLVLSNLKDFDDWCVARTLKMLENKHASTAEKMVEHRSAVIPGLARESGAVFDVGALAGVRGAAPAMAKAPSSAASVRAPKHGGTGARLYACPGPFVHGKASLIALEEREKERLRGAKLKEWLKDF